MYLERDMRLPERPEDLRSLYDRWRAIAPAAEQARLGCERYHEFQRLLSD